MKAVARLDWGRWVADCPAPHCTNALALQPGQERFVCRAANGGGCGTAAPVTWPDNIRAVQDWAAGLPESAQNWQPEPADD